MQGHSVSAFAPRCHTASVTGGRKGALRAPLLLAHHAQHMTIGRKGSSENPFKVNFFSQNFDLISPGSVQWVLLEIG